MKKLLITLAAVVLILGCSTTAYKTLYSVGHSVDSGYKAYMDLVVKGAIKTNSVPEIANKYNLFQISYTAALQVAQFSPKDTAAPADVTVRANDVLSAIAIAKGAK